MLQGGAQVPLQGLVAAGVGQGALEPVATAGCEGELGGPGPFGWSLAAKDLQQIAQEAVCTFGRRGGFRGLQRCSSSLRLRRPDQCFWC